MNLTTSETRIVHKLDGHGDVGISMLFRTLRGRWPEPGESNRLQQQAIGATICRANKKLEKEGKRIVPGVKRGSYRLIKI